MTGFKKGTGSLDFDDEEAAQAAKDAETVEEDTDEHDSESGADGETDSGSSQDADFNVDSLPYLVQRQMRGASVNADRTNQLLLEVRLFVKDDEDTFLNDLQDLVDGPVYKGDAREAAMVVAQENPELVAEKLREWGIEYLDK